MSVFAVIGYTELPKLKSRIEELYPAGKHYHLPPAAWFISDIGTTEEIGDKIGIKNGQLNVQAVVIAVNTYAGWVRSDFWEWLKAIQTPKT